jgi:hypothetical protein
MVVMDNTRITAHIYRYIGHVQQVMVEVFLDDMRLVAKAYDELVNAVMGVNLHNMP